MVRAAARKRLVSRLRGLGFADVKLYPAGFAHWAETEHSATAIGYAPQPKPGAMPLADFTALARALSRGWSPDAVSDQIYGLLREAARSTKSRT